MAVAAIPLLPEIGAGLFEASEFIGSTLFGASEAGITSAVAAVPEVASGFEGVATVAVDSAGSISLTPGVGALGLGDAGVPVLRGATDTSARTIFGSLPELSTTTKVVGGSVALDAGYNLVQNLRDTNQSLDEAFTNVPGGVIVDAETLMNHGGLVAGKVLGSTVSSVSKGAFGDENTLFNVALLAGAFYLWTR